MTRSFKALILDKEGNKVSSQVKDILKSELPDGDVLVKIHYSSLNYKDGLTVTGKGEIVKKYPFVPGIDFSGVIEESSSPSYKPGDKVILTGWGVGERHWGGFAQFARVQSNWLVPLPEGLTLKDAMVVGTAGLTAMLSVIELEKHGVDQGNRVIITGATGGVGSFSVYLLSKLGYEVTASTGKQESHDLLRKLGASSIMHRSILAAPGKPLDTQKWDGAIDTVGGQTLANVLSQTHYDGTVVTCGLTGGSDLPATLFPFILRGVKLIGIDSVMAPDEKRMIAWTKISEAVNSTALKSISNEISIHEVPDFAERIVEGKIEGRTVVNLGAEGKNEVPVNILNGI